MSSFLDAFDVSEEKLELLDKTIAQDPRQNDKRICICGHSMSRHKRSEDTGRIECRPARFDCPCKHSRPVIEVPNTKYFLSRTLGSGEKHALTRGIFLSQKAIADEFNQNAKWIIDLKCDDCGEETKVFPVMCDSDGYRLYEAKKDGKDPDQGYYYLYCAKCREVYTDSDEANAKRNAKGLTLVVDNTATPS
jgi:hypothetical protein